MLHSHISVSIKADDSPCLFVKNGILNGKAATLAVIADRGSHSFAAPYFSGLWEDLLDMLKQKPLSPMTARRILEKGVTGYLSGSVFDRHHNFVKDAGMLALLFACGDRYELRCTGDCCVYRRRGHKLKSLLISEENDTENADEYTLFSRAGRLRGGDTFLLCRAGLFDALSPAALRIALSCRDEVFKDCTDTLLQLLPHGTANGDAALSVRFASQEQEGL